MFFWKSAAVGKEEKPSPAQGEETASCGTLTSLGDRCTDTAGGAAGGPAEGSGFNDGFPVTERAGETDLSGQGGLIRGPEEGKELIERVKFHDGPRWCPLGGGDLTSGETWKAGYPSIMAKLFKKSSGRWRKKNFGIIFAARHHGAVS